MPASHHSRKSHIYSFNKTDITHTWSWPHKRTWWWATVEYRRIDSWKIRILKQFLFLQALSFYLIKAFANHGCRRSTLCLRVVGVPTTPTRLVSGSTSGLQSASVFSINAIRRRVPSTGRISCRIGRRFRDLVLPAWTMNNCTRCSHAVRCRSHLHARRHERIYANFTNLIKF